MLPLWRGVRGVRAAAARPARRRACSSSTVPPSRVVAAASVAVKPEDTASIRKWVWLALGVSAAGVGASTAAGDRQHKARTDASTAPPAAPAALPPPLTAAAAAAVNAEAEAKKLKKRKSSLKGSKYVLSTAAVRGARTQMEDTSFVSGCQRFAAIFDGHGGASVSQFLKTKVFELLEPTLAQLDAENQQVDSGDEAADEARNKATEEARKLTVARALADAVERVDAEVLARNEWKYQGSTLVGVLLVDDLLFSVNVGDSRAILCRSGDDVVELTRDHKPNDPEEQARIESLGGRVKWYGYVDAQGEPMEPYGAYRINGNLAVARALGDRDARPYVSGEPEIKAFARDYYKDEFIVLASDGLWDVMTNEEVATFVQDVMTGEVGGRESWRSAGHADTRVPIFEWSQQYRSDRSMIKAARKRRKQLIANYLVQEALFRGSSDNVSVIVIWLR